MARRSKISETPPAAVESILQRLGQNIRIARLRRKVTIEELAERVGVSRYLMSDIEKGKPTAAVAAYVGALWALGLADGLRSVGDPDADAEGKALEGARTPKTAHKPSKAFDNDF
jgi:transcriptional regulator with XRE-family HTH domain